MSTTSQTSIHAVDAQPGVKVRFFPSDVPVARFATVEITAEGHTFTLFLQSLEAVWQLGRDLNIALTSEEDKVAAGTIDR